MSETKKRSVCIAGAGAMGIMTGYHLALAGADISLLVRERNRERLSRPQLLYCYDDHSMKTFSGYDLITDPGELTARSFDFIVITLDANSLRAEAGRKMVEAIGRSCRGTSTGVVLGSVGLDLRSWFLECSGLSEQQVTDGVLTLFACEERRASMPVLPGVRVELRDQADYGYRHVTGSGFAVDSAAPEVAQDFSRFYDRCQVSRCAIMSPEDYRLQFAIFGAVMAMELLDWSAPGDIDPADPTWVLGIEAMREIQRLSIYGDYGVAVSEQTGARNVLDSFRQMEEDARPFDFAAFFRYHHGGKVSGQDYDILREALQLGKADSAPMPALSELIDRLEANNHA